MSELLREAKRSAAHASTPPAGAATLLAEQVATCVGDRMPLFRAARFQAAYAEAPASNAATLHAEQFGVGAGNRRPR
jgi:hypothetical protein